MEDRLVPKSDYPRGLRKLPSYREMPLWYEGNLRLFSTPLASVIGTREISDAGLLRTRRITKLLVSEGYTVVSGLAKGVDATAHSCALDLEGNTIAVMGTPIDQCYPKENLALKQAIATRGLVLSQFNPCERVHRSNFPKRNSLMAALSDFTLVIEAGEKSGTRHQVLSAVRMRKPVAFLASLVDKQYPWIQTALDSGYGFMLSEPDDLLKLIHEHRKHFESPPREDEQQAFAFGELSTDESDEAPFEEKDIVPSPMRMTDVVPLQKPWWSRFIQQAFRFLEK